MRKTVVWLALTFGLLTCCHEAEAADSVYGLNFSPLITGQNPDLGAQVTAAQILQRLEIVAPYTTWVRSFGMTHGLEQVPQLAHQRGKKVAAGAWLSRDLAQNSLEINNLIAAANAGFVDIAIVGSEVIRRGDLTEIQLIAYMNQVRQAIPAGIPVTTAEIYGLLSTNLIAASDVVFANIYPYWEGTLITNALCSVRQNYQQLVAAAGAKPVIISETGWPSAGQITGSAIPSETNANTFARQFFTWATANAIPSFYFEAFDEAWKVSHEGEVGAHWGIWDANGAIKPGMDAFFNGARETVDCNAPLPGQVGLVPVYVPPYGSSDVLELRVTGVRPGDYKIATYIFVNGWWTKPTFAQPTVAINPDGTVRIPIVTGGSDQFATQIAAFLIPTGVSPPSASITYNVNRTIVDDVGTNPNGTTGTVVGFITTDGAIGNLSRSNILSWSLTVDDDAGGLTPTINETNSEFGFDPTNPLLATLTTLSFDFSGTGDVLFVGPSGPGGPLRGNIFWGLEGVNGSLVGACPAQSSGCDSVRDSSTAWTAQARVSAQVIATAAGGGALPSLPDAVATMQVTRSTNSISGTIIDSLGAPISGVVVAGPSIGSAVSASDGKYSFYSIGNVGSAVLTASRPNYVFPTSPATVNSIVGNQQVNFVGVTVNSPPATAITADSVTPNSGSGGSQTFAFQFGDTLGAADLAQTWVWINATLAESSAGSCMTYYAAATQTLSLLNDAGTAWMPAPINGGGMLENSQCAIALGGASTAALAGNRLTLTLAITFKAAFNGAKNVYLYAANASGATSGWQQRGTWTAAAAAPIGPVITADSVTPNSGSGGSQTFAFQFGDTLGAADLAQTWVWINATLAESTAGSCMTYYAAATQTLSLLNDAGTAWMPAPINGGGMLENSQCAIALGGASTAALAGNRLTLTLAITFKAAFNGAKNVYLYAANASGATSGWQQRGTWTAAAAAPIGPVITADSVTPNSGSGGSQTFAFQFGDTLGAADLAQAWIWINATLAESTAGSCMTYYAAATNTLSLLNDAGTAWMPAPINGGGRLENSQCTIALGGASTAALAGNRLTLTLAVTFKAAFNGAKNVYLYAANDSGATSGWQPRGTWTAAGD